jgi:sugar phosphate isomerase/epimerase
MIRLGGPVFQALSDWEQVGPACRRAGYSAAYCPHQIKAGDAAAIAALRTGCAKADVVIAEVGAWCNMTAPEPDRRRKNLDFVIERLTLADEVGALCCVDYLGTMLPGSDFGPHPFNLSPAGFDLAVETVRAVIDGAKPKRTSFCLEMMEWLLPDSPDVYLRLIKAVDRPSFAVHLDPVNLIVSPRMYFDTGALLRECFAKLGPWIRSCHAKDITLGGNLSLHLDEVRPGLGNLDYRTFLSELDRLEPVAPLMLEHLSQADYPVARDHILGVGRDIGVKFA